MKPTMQTTATPAEKKPARIATDGGSIGKAINKLLALNEAEQRELQTTPATIREKFSGKRQAFLNGLEPHIRDAALAATVAMQPAKAAAE